MLAYPSAFAPQTALCPIFDLPLVPAYHLEAGSPIYANPLCGVAQFPKSGSAGARTPNQLLKRQLLYH